MPALCLLRFTHAVPVSFAGDAEVEAQRAEALLAGMMSPESGYSSGDDEASVQVQAAQVVHAVREEVAAAQAAAAGAAAARHPRKALPVFIQWEHACVA